MKKKIKANLCVFLGSICLPMAGAESENFVIQIIVTITAAALFIFFFVQAARLYAQKDNPVKVYTIKLKRGRCGFNQGINHS